MSHRNHKQNKKEFSTIKRRVLLTGWVVALTAFAVLALALTGCKKFLDVQPQDRVPQTTLFNDEQGFKDALTGVYLGMDKPTTASTTFGLYTNNLTMGMMSTLAFDYDNATTANAGTNRTFFNNVVNYYYADATLKLEIDGIWSSMYGNIANLNNIIGQIESRKSIFTGDNFERIKGEAIALRAMFHFDMARMFGQSPVTGMNVKAIPYIRSFGVRSTPFATLQNALDSCIADLNTAKELLANTDTAAVLKAGDDLFTAYTQNHMNYWAVQALMARVYLYKGDRDNADKYAKSVIASNKFPLITSNVAAANNTIRDRTFSQEHLFSIFSNNIKTNNNSLFSGSTIPLRLTPAGKNALYTTGSGSTNDYRFTSWFDNNPGGINVPSKYFQNNGLPYHLQNIVPLIRASEMYYIAAEAAHAKGDISGGTSFLNKVRQARGLTSLNAGGITNTDSLSKEIMREYQKEFIQEGQTFFYYKRLNKNLKQVTATTVAIPTDVYVFPIPDKEKEYN